VEEDANAPFESHLQAASGGCENVHLRVNHTLRMPAKVGPKRDRALARAGCYFDSSAAVRSAKCVLDLREATAFVQLRSLRARLRVRSGISTSLRAKAEAIHSFFLCGGEMDCRFARNDGGYSFTISRR
jgi:hypothetical protein